MEGSCVLGRQGPNELVKRDAQVWPYHAAWCTPLCSPGQEWVEEHSLVKMLVHSAHWYILSAGHFALFEDLQAIPEGKQGNARLICQEQPKRCTDLVVCLHH